MGYWEQSLIYPKVVSGGTDTGRQTANSLIVALVEKYVCEEPGEHSFNASVTYASDNLISFRYENMWMCSGMPGPDSVSGAVTIDLHTGKDISLKSQLSNESPSNEKNSAELKDLVVAGLNAIIDKKSADLNCAQANDLGSYYLTVDDFIFLHLNPAHGGSVCDADYAIPKQQLKAFLRTDSVLLK